MFTRNGLLSLFAIICFSSEFTHAGIIVEYRFDGNANDTSGNAYHGTINGGANFTAGKHGQAIQFDGLDDWVDMNLPIQNNTAYTVELWFNANSLSGSPHIFSINHDAPNDYVAVWDPTTSGVSVWHHTPGVGFANSTAFQPLSTGTWYHFAQTWDGSNRRMYIDGVLKTTVAANDNQGHGGTGVPGSVVGARYSGNTQFFNGLVDELRFHDTALAVDQLGFFNDGAAAVPEPSTFAMFGIGAFACIACRKRKPNPVA